jgi:heme exporter protein C
MAVLSNKGADTTTQKGMGWKMLAGILMAYVCYGAFFVAKGGVNFTGNGQVARIVFFHVPVAIVSYVAYVVGWVYAVIFLKNPARLDCDRKSAVAMELGFLFCILATVTGSIFAGSQWGSYWNWDPREISIVVMLLLYGAYLALRTAMDDPQKRGKVSAVYVLIALVPATFLIWVVPRITAGLHPTDTLAKPKNTSLDYKMVLYPAFIAFHMIFAWLFQLRCRMLEIIEKRSQRRFTKTHG